MKNNLHPVERARQWSKENLERFMVFCILNTQIEYNKLCQCFEELDNAGLTTKESISSVPAKFIRDILKETGYRFYNQKARYLKEFSKCAIDLERANREELVKIKGVGMKLASMFLVRTRGADLAIIDTHIKKWLKERNLWHNKYEEAEKNFAAEAAKLGMSVKELDLKICEEKRRRSNIKWEQED